MSTNRFRLPPITLLMIIIEFLIIICASVNATSAFLTPDPNQKIGGYEGEYLTSSATFASVSLHEFGYIPLWEPYLSHGEPLIDGPFSFVLNPISSIPSLIYGSNLGIRYSIVLTAILAGLGGWALGRNLGFGSLGRVLLGLLLAGKGNMIGLIGAGDFQLGGSQAYIPWVLAGVIGIFRLRDRRISVVLTALMLTLMFWAGNIYFLLPTLISVAGLTLTHCIDISRVGRRYKVKFEWTSLAYLMLAGVLTLGLSAITFLPIFVNQGQIGAHINETDGGTYADLPTVVGMFFSDSTAPYTQGLLPGGEEFYQSYILPLWFALLAFIGFPLLTRFLSKRSKSDRWKVWTVGIVAILFFTLWGTGQNPIIAWVEARSALLGQWRFVGRMLGVATFWIAVLAVMQVDALWRALGIVPVWKRSSWRQLSTVVRLMLIVLVAAASLLAGFDVLSQWGLFSGPIEWGQWNEDQCVEWLRQQNPDKYLSVWTLQYSEITVYLENRVRHESIGAAYFALGMPSTLFNGDLTHTYPEYGMPWDSDERNFLTRQGYQPMIDSPLTGDETNQCIWQKADALPYTFGIPLHILGTLNGTLPFEYITPIPQFSQHPDQITMNVNVLPVDSLVVTVQEVAYPGWTVQVDDQPAKLESVGGLLGVVIPPGTGSRVVRFAYHPPLLFFGGVLTLISAVFCIIYLLRVERLIPRRWIVAVGSITKRTGRNAYWLLTSPELFEPRDSTPAEIPLLPPETSKHEDRTEQSEAESDPPDAEN